MWHSLTKPCIKQGFENPHRGLIISRWFELIAHIQAVTTHSVHGNKGQNSTEQTSGLKFISMLYTCLHSPALLGLFSILTLIFNLVKYK